jgi:predicted nucleic acid-binding Zn ribbon protein
MPLYLYGCPVCLEEAEYLMVPGDLSPRCAVCLQRMMRLPSAPAIHFKGAGFYHNDYGPGKVKPSDA